MKAKHLAIGLAFLGAIMACNLPSPPYDYISSAIDCALEGGEFIPPEVNEETGRITPEYCIVGEEEIYYDHPPEELQVENLQVEEPQVENPQEPPPPAAVVEEDLPIEQCLVPPSGFSAVYEGAQRTDEGPDAHGGRCTGEFVITNLSAESIIVMGFDVFDNNAMQDSNYWRQYWLEPGDEHRENISYTWRPDDPDGDTFNYIAKILPVRNVNACIWLVHDQALQEVLALDIPAPCH